MVKAQTMDVVIIGGGLVGGTLGVSLAQRGFSVTVIDREDPVELLKPDVDGRTTAVAYGSKCIFDLLGIWPKIEHAAEPIKDIRVFEKDSPWSIYYDHKEIGSDPMGYIVENHALRQGIFQRAAELSESLTWVAPADVKSSQRNVNIATVYLSDGRVFNTPLVVGAEGRLSPTREQAGIKILKWAYSQVALIAHVSHEKPHQGGAWEVFQPEGPFAILPMRDHPRTGEHRSGIVWTSCPDEINRLMDMDDVAISTVLQEIFPYYGNIHLSGKRWTYPLSAMIARGTTDQRLVIIGDAAHTVHPVAGQGVNLGWRDVKVLSEVLDNARSLGLDIGSKSILSDYQRHRRLDTASILAMTDGMVRLFSNKSSILSFLRNAGLGIVNELPPVKRRLMRHAMGI